MKGNLPADWLLRLLPFLRWWPRVDRGTLRADAIAGLTYTDRELDSVTAQLIILADLLDCRAAARFLVGAFYGLIVLSEGDPRSPAIPDMSRLSMRIFDS